MNPQNLSTSFLFLGLGQFFYIFDISWPNVYSSRSYYSIQELYFLKEVERFLGFTNYHRAFIEEYTLMALPLQALTGKRAYQWGEEQERAFDELRKAMVRAPVLALPNATDPLILDTDASDKSVGAELIQIQEGEERAVLVSVRESYVDSGATKILHHSKGIISNY
jgi:hypothetical protein